jgi:Lactate racemase N-terminal domain
VICDVTRPFPARRVLPVLLDELPPRRVTIFVATGTHRACTADELEEMLGSEMLERQIGHQLHGDPLDRLAGVNLLARVGHRGGIGLEFESASFDSDWLNRAELHFDEFDDTPTIELRARASVLRLRGRFRIVLGEDLGDYARSAVYRALATL